MNRYEKNAFLQQKNNLLGKFRMARSGGVRPSAPPPSRSPIRSFQPQSLRPQNPKPQNLRPRPLPPKPSLKPSPKPAARRSVTPKALKPSQQAPSATAISHQMDETSSSQLEKSATTKAQSKCKKQAPQSQQRKRQQKRGTSASPQRCKSQSRTPPQKQNQQPAKVKRDSGAKTPQQGKRKRTERDQFDTPTTPKYRRGRSRAPSQSPPVRQKKPSSVFSLYSQKQDEVKDSEDLDQDNLDQDQQESDLTSQNSVDDMKQKTLKSYDMAPQQASMCADSLKTSYKPKDNYFAKGKQKYPSKPRNSSRSTYAQPTQRKDRRRKGAASQVSTVSRSKRQEISFEMVSGELFSLRFKNWMNQQLLTFLKQFVKDGSSKWIPEQRQWVINFKNYDTILAHVTKLVHGEQGEALSQATIQDDYNRPGSSTLGLASQVPKDDVQIHAIPDYVFNLKKIVVPFSANFSFDQHLSRFKYEKDFQAGFTINCIPESLRNSLFPFQHAGVAFGIRRHGRFLLGDEMGVGKTIQALAVGSVYVKDWPMIIICPKSLKLTWRDEIKRWLPAYADEINLIENGKGTVNNDKKIHICSYEIATKLSHQFLKRGIGVAICDEAHYLKSTNSKRSQSLVPILTRIKRLLLLSGTPMVARPVELFNCLKMLRPDIFNDFFEYVNRYCDPKEGPYGPDYSGAAHTKELHYILEDKIMIRRLKKHVLSELPPKLRQKIVVTTDSKIVRQISHILKRNLDDTKQRKSLEEAINNRNKKFKQTGTMDSNGLMGEMEKSLDSEIFANAEEKQIIKAYKLSGEAKIGGTIEYIETLIESEQKFLLFAHHQTVLNAVENHMKQKHAKVGYIRIDGSTKGDLRHTQVKQFQEEPEVRVAILSITAACVGLTLTAATTVVFAEVHWTPALMLQAEDRVHRIGQTASCVNIMYLYGESTLDEILFPMVQFKNAIVSNTLDGQRSEFKIKSQPQPVDPNAEDIEDDLENFTRGQSQKNSQEEDIDGFILRNQEQLDKDDDDYNPVEVAMEEDGCCQKDDSYQEDLIPPTPPESSSPQKQETPVKEQEDEQLEQPAKKSAIKQKRQKKKLTPQEAAPTTTVKQKGKKNGGSKKKPTVAKEKGNKKRTAKEASVITTKPTPDSVQSDQKPSKRKKVTSVETSSPAAPPALAATHTYKLDQQSTKPKSAAAGQEENVSTLVANLRQELRMNNGNDDDDVDSVADKDINDDDELIQMMSDFERDDEEAKVDQPSRQEPSRQDLSRQEPSLTETSRPEPSRLETSQLEQPIQLQPTRLETSRPEPTRVETSRLESKEIPAASILKEQIDEGKEGSEIDQEMLEMAILTPLEEEVKESAPPPMEQQSSQKVSSINTQQMEDVLGDAMSDIEDQTPVVQAPVKAPVRVPVRVPVQPSSAQAPKVNPVVSTSSNIGKTVDKSIQEPPAQLNNQNQESDGSDLSDLLADLEDALDDDDDDESEIPINSQLPQTQQQSLQEQKIVPAQPPPPQKRQVPEQKRPPQLAAVEYAKPHTPILSPKPQFRMVKNESPLPSPIAAPAAAISNKKPQPSKEKPPVNELVASKMHVSPLAAKMKARMATSYSSFADQMIGKTASSLGQQQQQQAMPVGTTKAAAAAASVTTSKLLTGQQESKIQLPKTYRETVKTGLTSLTSSTSAEVVAPPNAAPTSSLISTAKQFQGVRYQGMARKPIRPRPMFPQQKLESSSTSALASSLGKMKFKPPVGRIPASTGNLQQLQKTAVVPDSKTMLQVSSASQASLPKSTAMPTAPQKRQNIVPATATATAAATGDQAQQRGKSREDLKIDSIRGKMDQLLKFKKPGNGLKAQLIAKSPFKGSFKKKPQ